jgi:transposase-like protein
MESGTLRIADSRELVPAARWQPAMRSRPSPTRIRSALRALERGASVAAICRRLGIARTTLERWRKDAWLLDENLRLRRRVRALTTDKLMLQYILKQDE